MTGWFLQPDQEGAVLLALLAVPLIWLSVTDLKRHVIPDTASFGVAVLGVWSLLGSGDGVFATTFVGAVAIVVLLGLAGDVYWRRHGVEALGLGDAKLIGAGTLLVGLQNIWLMFLVACIGGIVAALLARRRGERGIPFGPFLAFAIYVVTGAASG